MTQEELTKIIWPTSVDMIAQVVVAMTFFFLLMFVILAYFLKQIELNQRVKTNETTFQILYQPVRDFIGQTEIERKELEKPNIDELILQIRDFVLSVPEDQVITIESLIAKRDELVGELYNLGYTGYRAENPFSGAYAELPIVTTEQLPRQGQWSTEVVNDQLIVQFADNSLNPDPNLVSNIRSVIGNFAVNGGSDAQYTISVYDSQFVQVNNLSQTLSLRRSINLRNLLRSSNVNNEAIDIVNLGINQQYPNGAVVISYER